MLEIASQIVLCLLLAALIGFIIGYLLGKSTCAEDNCDSANKDVSHDSHGTDDAHATETQKVLSTKDDTKILASKKETKVSKKTKKADSGNTDKSNATEAKKTTKAKEKTKASQETKKTKTQSSVGAKKATEPTSLLLSKPRDGKKDNLTRIKGVGVKIEEALNKIGIYHFDQIAAWTTENIAWADTSLGFPGRAKREKWVKQAKALASGKETEFSKRVDAGRVSSSKQS